MNLLMNYQIIQNQMTTLQSPGAVQDNYKQQIPPAKFPTPSLQQKNQENKNCQQSPIPHQQHANKLILTTISKDCYYSDTCINFSHRHRQNATDCCFLPVFNKDNRYYTPGFMMSGDSEYYEGNVQFDKDAFQEKKKKYEREASENRLEESFERREPRSKYCYVCKYFYQNRYYEHIFQKHHVDKLKSSKGEQYMEEEIKKFTQNLPQKTIKKQKIPKTKIIVKKQRNLEDFSVKTRSQRSQRQK